MDVKYYMNEYKLFENWEPEIVKEEIVASGDWFYQNEIKYAAKLIKQTWNYTSFELDEMFEKAIDYVSFEVSDEGVVYIWKFEKGTIVNYSNSFSTYFKAKDHINTYGYKYDISWA